MTASMLILTCVCMSFTEYASLKKEVSHSISKIIIKTIIITITTTILLGFVKDLYYTPKVS